MDPDGGKQEVFANTGGRVLGFDFDADGRMIAADAMKGLLAIGADGSVSLLADQRERRRSDRLRQLHRRGAGRHDLLHRRLDALCARATGAAPTKRACSTSSSSPRPAACWPTIRRPETTRIVARGLLVRQRHRPVGRWTEPVRRETGRYRIWKIDAGARDIDVQARLAAGPGAARQPARLSGQPDARSGRAHLGRSVQAAQSGGGWPRRRRRFCARCCCGCRAPCCRSASPTDMSSPSTRTAASSRTCRIPIGAYPETTGATETADRLYIHSLHAPAIGWLPR